MASRGPTVAVLDTRISRVERDMKELRADIREITSSVQTARECQIRTADSAKAIERSVSTLVERVNGSQAEMSRIQRWISRLTGGLAVVTAIAMSSPWWGQLLLKLLGG